MTIFFLRDPKVWTAPWCEDYTKEEKAWIEKLTPGYISDDSLGHSQILTSRYFSLSFFRSLYLDLSLEK